MFVLEAHHRPSFPLPPSPNYLYFLLRVCMYTDYALTYTRVPLCADFLFCLLVSSRFDQLIHLSHPSFPFFFFFFFSSSHPTYFLFFTCGVHSFLHVAVIRTVNLVLPTPTWSHLTRPPLRSLPSLTNRCFNAVHCVCTYSSCGSAATSVTMVCAYAEKGMVDGTCSLFHQ